MVMQVEGLNGKILFVMKYIFVITNHTSFLSSMGTMNYLNLEHKDVVFYTVRNYKNDFVPIDWTMRAVDDFFDLLYHLVSEKPSEIKKKIRMFDDFVEQDIKGEYEAFIPHLSHPMYLLIATNKKCKNVSFVQEGILSYKNVFLTHRKWWEKLKTKLGQIFKYRTFRIWGTGGWYAEGTLKQKELHSYATNDRLFKYLPSINHVIQWPHIEVDLSLKPDAVYFLFDGFVVNGFVESSYYLNACEKLIKEYGGTYNYLKFHPNETLNERNAIKGYFDEQNMIWEELPSSLPFELILASENNLKVVGLGTSLLFVAHELGHHVECHDDWLQDSPKFQIYMKNFGCQLFKDIYK